MTLSIEGLSISATDGRRLVHDLTLTVGPGEMLGLVGESGSGKSLTATAVLGLMPGGLRVTAGQIRLNSTDLLRLRERELRQLRGKQIAYIFQHYQGSFTPFLKIGRQLVEAIRAHERISDQAARTRALEWLDRVQLPADRVFGSYPFQLSGGQVQRAALAAALMLQPALVIADEPTTALDVLTGERVLDLLVSLQREAGSAVLLISHDLNHVLRRTDRMAVMYGGRVVESGPTERMGKSPQHPYTQLLLRARPTLCESMPDQLATIPGEAGVVAPTGCPFALRCPVRIDSCDRPPAMLPVGAGHLVACHLLRSEGGSTLDHATASAD